MGPPPWELTIVKYTMSTTLNSELESEAETSRVCRMIRWFQRQHEAERELEQLLKDGWSGTLHDCLGIWQVDVVRLLRDLA